MEPGWKPARRRIELKLLGAFGLAGLLVATICWPPRPLLLWNASASSPTGLYLLSPPRQLSPGDHLAAWAPDWARRLGAERRYIPVNVPLVKRIGAIAGDEICALGDQLNLNGRLLARRRNHDSAGRTMPRWEGCRRLSPGEYFLLDPRQPGAFDGRYFGITFQRDLIGKARLIWPG